MLLWCPHSPFVVFRGLSADIIVARNSSDTSIKKKIKKTYKKTDIQSISVIQLMTTILPLVDGKNVGKEKPGVITLNASSSALI